MKELPDSRTDRSLLSPRQEARVFWRMRRRLLANLLRQSLDQARLRLALVMMLTGLLWVGQFALFAEGFQFLKATIPEEVTHDETVRAVFHIFFVSLMLMLVVSTAIILYSGLFRSGEARFLLSMPATAQRVFLHKFQESVLFSSWGFMLLGSPMFVAYGVVEDAGAFFYAVLLPFMLGFVYIPAGVGAVAVLVLVRWLPRIRRHLAWAAAAAAAAALAAAGWSLAQGLDNDLLTPGWFQGILGRLRFSESPLLPSWWLSSGLLEGARSGWRTAADRTALSESALFLALTLSNALVLREAALATAARLYRPAYSSLHGERTSRRRIRNSWIDLAAWRLLGPLTPPMRLLVLKDLRLFRRDPVQWLQVLIFFGLLALYFLNIRRLRYDVNYASWINMISFLNLAAVGLILSTFTTRFVYPMISLEGRRFWILGLLPIRREMVLWSKFLFATAGSLIPSTLLILLSDIMLRVPPLVVGVHVMACALLCSGLVGIAVGLGARMPNFREDSPSRIAAGFGGTLNLVASTVYIVSIVALTAVPCHFYLAQNLGLSDIPPERISRWLALGVSASIALGVLATFLPLQIGFRAFRRMEF